MKFKTNILILLFISIAMVSCRNTEARQKDLEISKTKEQSIAVKTQTIAKDAFAMELTSNGVLRLEKKVKLMFQREGILKNIFISNGDRVRKGDTLAILNMQEVQMNLEDARIGVIQSKNELLDLLISQHHRSLADTALLSEHKKDFFLVKSGLSKARNQLHRAQHEKDRCFIVAPFSGWVADVAFQEYDQVQKGEELCILLDDSHWYAEFPLMESEVAGIATGSSVEISSFYDSRQSIPGHIAQVNPLIDEHGLVLVKAKLHHAPSWLMEGRNVKVKVQQMIPNQLIIPKEAVVLRSGREVIFILENGRAKWVYVDVLTENEHQMSVSGKIKAGDEVIISNQLHLSHDASVKKINTEADG